MTGIILSEKHGLNPTIPSCFYCGELRNELIILGKLINDKTSPMHCGIFNYTPCETCKKHMAHGIMVVSVSDEAKEGDTNPLRTGKIVVLKEKAIRSLFDDDSAIRLLKYRFAYLKEEPFNKLFADDFK